MKDVIYQELKTANDKVKGGILLYTGSGDPITSLNEAVNRYVRHEGYREFIDANMDNPWVRIIVKGINEMEKVEFKPEMHHL